jgi:GTP-binding protein Era
VIADADVILFMIEATRWHEDDAMVLEKLTQVTAPIILVINKIDLLKDKSRLLPLIDRLKEKLTFAEIVPLSAKTKDNVSALEKIIVQLLPEGPHLFPDEQVTSQESHFQIAELIREKLMQLTEQEIPYSTTVTVDSLQEENNLLKISAIIWVEREGQKAIVIGKDGEKLKRIGTLARKDIEKVLGKKVFLRLWVKVKSDWTDNDRLLQGFGFE